jgi:hypothetical protein
MAGRGDRRAAAARAAGEKTVRRDRALVAAGAIALIAAAAIGVVWLWPRGDGAPARDPRQIRVEPTQVLRPGDTLRWSAVPGAAKYVIEAISASDGRPSWRTTTTAPEVVWPPFGAAAVPGRYRYRVVATALDGVPLGGSTLLGIEIVAPPPAPAPAP